MAIETRLPISSDGESPNPTTGVGVTVLENPPEAELVLPKKQPSRTNWPLRTALTTFSILTIGGVAALLSHDKGPSAPPVDNGAASDTFKPPGGGGLEIPNVVISPGFPDTQPSVSPSGTGPDNPPDLKPKPEPKEIKCFLNTPEVCKTARLVKIGTREYVELSPGAKITITTRLSGEITVTPAEEPFQGVFISVVDRNTTETENYWGAITTKINPLWVPIENGKTVGDTQENGKIYVRYTKRDGPEIVLDKERTNRDFPGIFEKPIEELTSTDQSKAAISYKFERDK